MRMTEAEYEALMAKRVGIMGDLSRQLNIPATAKQLRQEAHKTIAPQYLPPNQLLQVVKPRSDKTPKRGKPNKSEAEYGRMLAMEFPGAKISFEAITLRLENSHSYTADWVVKMATGELLLVECKARGKNGYRHPSYQRAKVMFDQSKLEYPQWQWRWAEKQNGTWSVTP